MKNLFYILTILFLFTSCYQKSKSINIADFSQSIHDTLVPKKNSSYSAGRYKIKGYSNDTIKIKFQGIEKLYFGEFEYDFMTDYYGVIDVDFMFVPYKATEGEIHIEYGIY